jgi:phosphoribosylamine--glycine ligase
VAVFDSSGLGDLAEELREAGVPVVGGGKFCDKLEFERDFSMDMMKRIGCDMPDYQVFSTISDTIKHVWHNRHKGLVINGKVHEKVYFKTNAYIDSDATRSADNPEDLIRFLRRLKGKADRRINILQECIDGPDVSTGRWWNGKAWVGPYLGTIEKKKTFGEDIGPSTGASVTAVWWYPEEEPLVAKALHWDKLAGEFLRHNAPPGWYDINAILKDGKAWFLEWTPRFGWDSEGVAMPLLYQSLPDWLKFITLGVTSDKLGLSNKIAYGIRLGVPPYPWEQGKRDEKGSAVGIGIWGEPTKQLSGQAGFVGYELRRSNHRNELDVAAPDGLVGLAVSAGEKLSVIHEEAVAVIKKIKTSSALIWSPDGADSICENAERAIEEVFTDIPKGLIH